MKTPLLPLEQLDSRSRIGELSFGEALAEIDYVYHYFTDPDRIYYPGSGLIEIDKAICPIRVIDPTIATGNSFKSISMSNFPESIKIPVLASAGSAAIGLANAALREGKEVAIFVPNSIMQSKKESIEDLPNVHLDDSSPSFEDAITKAKVYAKNNAGASAVSGSGVTCISALQKTLVKDIISQLQEEQGTEETDDVTLCLQVGAGSLATASIVSIQRAIVTKKLNEHRLRVILVRPALNDMEYFDGLNVQSQGPHATSILFSKYFQTSLRTISLADSAMAHKVTATAFSAEAHGRKLEPTGLSGIAGALADMRQRSLDPYFDPTRHKYLAILSGANGSAETEVLLRAA